MTSLVLEARKDDKKKNKEKKNFRVTESLHETEQSSSKEKATEEN